MLELPEAVVISRQLSEKILGKKIVKVTAAQSPHKFAWYYGDPQDYHNLLGGKIVVNAASYGGWVEIKAGDFIVAFCDGINLRFHRQHEKRPQKHQLLIELDDSSAISASVQMYGGLLCFKEDEIPNEYYLQAKDKPSPLSDQFDRAYFDRIISKPEAKELSAKALLATKQRIPGLGNGILQDILFNAKIHPKRKVKTFTKDNLENLYKSIRFTLPEMVSRGGRDTEKDLFGNFGGYKTIASKLTVDKPCDECGCFIKKEPYMGGSIYYCSGCQKL
jgi:formamidopyrimidine-DNA glycosylase